MLGKQSVNGKHSEVVGKVPKIFCTMTSSHLLNENLESNGLKYLAEHELGVPKEQIKKYTEVIPGTQEFFEYGMNDVIWTYQLYKKYSPQIEKEGLHHLFYDVEMPFQKVLMWLAINGIRADVSAANTMRYEVHHFFYTIENELLNIFGGKYVTSITPRSRVTSCKPSINFNSSDQVVPLIEGLGFPIYERSKKKKKKSWNKQSKNRLKGKHYAIDLLIKLGTVEKLLNGFLVPFERFVDVDGRIRCSFHNTVCVTGRLSCSKPNIEQLPKNNTIANIRNLFVAEYGNVLIVADYSGQEVRIMAQESDDKTFKDALINGLDLHQVTADAMGVSRDDAKCIVFGTAYGKSAYGFSKDFNCSEKEAQVFIDKFFTQYPGLKRAIEKTKEQVYKHGFVKNMSGRKRRFPDFHKLNKWGKEKCYRQAFNFKIQSYGADVVKKAAFDIIKNINLKITNLVHDEIVVECKKEYVEEGIKYINECMVKALPIFLKWDIDISFSTRYGECK